MIYKPWSLAVNLTSPFMPSLIGDGDMKTTMLSLSWSFGPGR